MKLMAPAKINLGLSILGKLSNNYHEVKTIYSQISLFDIVEITSTRDKDIKIKVNWSEVPTNKDNLVWRAVALIRKEHNIKKGVMIKLEKHIPIGSGLGGGSSDAAVTLKGLNELWELGMDLNELIGLAKKIGSDVAYQLVGGVKLELQGGRRAGEFEELIDLPKCWIVVCTYDEMRSSRKAYEEVDYNRINKNNLSGLIGAITDENLTQIGKNLHNDFEAWVIEEFTEAREVKRIMIENGAVGSVMSGKGLTVFGLFTEEELARSAINVLKNYYTTYLVRPYYG